MTHNLKFLLNVFMLEGFFFFFFFWEEKIEGIWWDLWGWIVMLEVGEENLVFAHAKKVNTNVLVQAEVEDISSAITLASKAGVSNVIVESDSH